MRSLSRIMSPAVIIAVAACASPDKSLPTAPDPSLARKPPNPSAIVLTVLPTLGGSSEALAINDNSVIVGSSKTGGITYPVRWTPVGEGWQVVKLQNASGAGADVNEAGAAAGTVGGQATYWPAGGGAETIGPGSARALNDAGVVVGFRAGAPNGGAVAWTRSGGGWIEHTLPRQPGVTTGFNEVDDIGNDGTIVGYAQGANGVQHAVKWVLSTTTPGEWEPAIPLDAHAGATNSAALGIEGPDIVGLIWRCTPTCTTREGWHWLLAGAGLGSLGPEDAWPDGLNASRYTVGVRISSSRGRTSLRPAVWSPGQPTFQDLGVGKGASEGWAKDINNPTATRTAKQAVGYNWGNDLAARRALLWVIP